MFKPLRDYPILVRQWLNPWLRKPRILALLQLATLPFESTFERLTKYIKTAWTRVNITPQAFALEYYLNTRFLNENYTSMYITDGDFHEVDFIVNIENRHYNNKALLSEIEYFLDTYKLAGHRYKIVSYYRELTGPWSRKFGKKFFWKF
jgi:hypothetical protein